ncbi:MAG: YetF domain-containing protein [Neobacillus sp.]
MNFFHGQETLTSLEWILRAIVSYFFLVIVTKVMGQRSISQLRLLDFVVALVLGNIIAHPLSDEELGLKGSMLTTIVFVGLYIGSVFTILKWPGVRKLINSAPITLVKDGEIKAAGLKKARISIDVLLEELRKENIDDIKKVALTLWEADGKISVFLDPKHEPITPSTYNLQTEPFDLPKIIIKEGKIDLKQLREVNLEEGWLVNTLTFMYQTEVKNVLLATIDQKENLKVFLYE